MESAACSLLALASLALQAPQDAPAAAPTAAVAQTDERAKELNRILHFTGGGCLRAKARFVGDHWEYRDSGQWTALPAHAVERALLERDVLAQAKELARTVGRDDGVQRVHLADWMLRAGLLDEGFVELGRVLERDPDQQDALALLRAPPVAFRVPGADVADLAEALRVAALTPRALQEAAIAQLGRRTDEAATKAALSKALVSHSPRIRAFAAHALRRLDPQADLRGLIGRAVLDGSDEVRLEAALALRDAQQVAVILPVVKALGSSSPALRENAIQALGNMGYPDALEPLAARLAALSAAPPQGGGSWSAPRSNIFVGRQFAYIQDFDVEVAQFAAVADPQVNVGIEGAVLDVRIIGVWETSVAIESRNVRSALGKLSGASPGNSNRSWLDWWEQHKGEFGVKSPPRPSTGASH